MKITLITLFTLVTISVVFAPPNLNDPGPNEELLAAIEYKRATETEELKKATMERLWRATCYVETRNNPKSINRQEMAFGIVQVRKIRLYDYFNETGKRYKLRDMLDTSKAKEVYMYYAEKNLDPETISRKWNGSGPMTTKYWNKVKKHI